MARKWLVLLLMLLVLAACDNNGDDSESESEPNDRATSTQTSQQATRAAVFANATAAANPQTPEAAPATAEAEVATESAIATSEATAEASEAIETAEAVAATVEVTVEAESTETTAATEEAVEVASAATAEVAEATVEAVEATVESTEASAATEEAIEVEATESSIATLEVTVEAEATEAVAATEEAIAATEEVGITAEMTVEVVEATEEPTLTVTEVAQASPTLPPTATQTFTPTIAATTTHTFTPTITATATITPTANIEETISAAVESTLAAQQPQVSSFEAIRYTVLYAPMLQISFVSPEDWWSDVSGNSALIQSPEHTTGVILQRGSRAALAGRGLLGEDADLVVAMENISLTGENKVVQEINQIPVDLLGVPTLELRAQEVSTVTLAYLMTLGDDDYLLVVGYAPLAEANRFEQQIVLPLLFSLDRGDGTAPLSEATPVPTSEASSATATFVPSNTPASISSPTLVPSPTTGASGAATATEVTTNTTASTPTQVAQVSTPLPSPTAIPLGEGMQYYNSLALQFSFQYPDGTVLEQEGPILVASSPDDEDAQVIFVRMPPDQFVELELFTGTEDPQAELAAWVEESLGQPFEVETTEMFGFTTYQSIIDEFPQIYVAYYLIDMGSEWLYIFVIAPIGEVNYKESLADPIISTLQVTPPVPVAEAVIVEFDTTFTSSATGVTAPVFADTQSTEGDGQVAFAFANGTITIYRGTPQQLVERGIISNDTGLISGLRSIATDAGFPDAVINPEQILTYDRAAYVEFTQDNVGYRYIGAVINESTGEWIIIEVSSTDYATFSTSVLPAFLDEIQIAPEIGGTMPAATLEVPVSGTVQPTYTPLPTYTPMPTYTQPANQ